MKCFPHCKINIGLHVVERRSDGYHNLETIFFPVHGLRDELEIERSDRETIELEGVPLDCPDSQNVCLKAYHMLRADFPERVGPVAIRLRKNIPFGAGLGGGSSDGAFALKMLDEIFGLSLGSERLHSYAARLGADCSFFIDNHACYATGIGDMLEPAEVALGDYKLALYKPDEAVSTREAYRGIVPHRHAVDLRQAVRRPIEEWKGMVVNDFEDVVFAGHPAIAKLKAMLYEAGAAFASMSGSGSTVFGIFPPDVEPCSCKERIL